METSIDTVVDTEAACSGARLFEKELGEFVNGYEFAYYSRRSFEAAAALAAANHLFRKIRLLTIAEYLGLEAISA